MSLAAVATVASCKPALIDNPEPDAAINAATLDAKLLTNQYTVDENGKYVASTEGNYIAYNFPAYSGVAYTLVEQKDGSQAESILATGCANTFQVKPKRGADPEMTIYFRAINMDGTTAEVSRKFTTTVPTDLPAEMVCLVGDAGVKTWSWAAGMECWGNAGNTGSGASYDNFNVDGKWWGVATPEDLLGQLDHSGGNEYGDESASAYMVFTEDGAVSTYDANGSIIRKSTYAIKDFDATRASGWALGTLETADPALLFPWSINEGGKPVTTFDLMHLNDNEMTLVYTKGNGAGSWGEITYWRFQAAQIEKTWTWAAADLAGVWGNAGNSGNGAGYTPRNVDGKWWGVADKAQFLDQKGHIAAGEEDIALAEIDANAKVVFDYLGNVKVYDGNGNVTREGSYEYALNDRTADGGRPENWGLGTLTVNGNMLFPYSINEGGVKVETFDIMCLTPNDMTLVYTKGNGSGSWAEITFWMLSTPATQTAAE